jgi:hypothetical protein
MLWEERKAEDEKGTQAADRRDCEGRDNSENEEVSGRKRNPLALFQEKERKARKFKEARLERKEAVDREQKRMEGIAAARK